MAFRCGSITTWRVGCGVGAWPIRALLLVCLVAGCQYLPVGFTPIGDIVARPTEFEGREIKIRGKVADVSKIPLIDVRGYVLKDETGSILVISHSTVPAMGQHIAVRGQAESALILAGQSFGLTFRELEKLPTW